MNRLLLMGIEIEIQILRPIEGAGLFIRGLHEAALQGWIGGYCRDHKGDPLPQYSASTSTGLDV